METDKESSLATTSTAQLEATKINRELFDAYKSVEIPFEDLTDVKRPLASTVGVLKVPSVSMKTPTSKQGEEPAILPGMEYPMLRDVSVTSIPKGWHVHFTTARALKRLNSKCQQLRRQISQNQQITRQMNNFNLVCLKFPISLMDRIPSQMITPMLNMDLDFESKFLL